MIHENGEENIPPFFSSATFNEEFMFVDDDEKMNLCTCDTHGNVVYEGRLRGKTHGEILELLRKVVVVLMGAKKIEIESSSFPKEERKYPHTMANCTILSRLLRTRRKMPKFALIILSLSLTAGSV